MRIYGIANGKGDFIRNLSEEQSHRINKLQNKIPFSNGINGIMADQNIEVTNNADVPPTTE